MKWFNICLTVIFPLIGLTSYGQVLPPEWSYTVTGIDHTVALPQGCASVNGNPVAPGDLLGAFYDDPATGLVCGGYVVYTSLANVLTVWGDDPLTPVKDGFSTGESLQWKVFVQASGASFNLIPDYLVSTTFPDSGLFVSNGVSSIASLANNLLNYSAIGVNGAVMIEGTTVTVPNHPVTISGSIPSVVTPVTLYTNSAGQFAGTIQSPVGLSYVIVVSTPGLCDGNPLAQAFFPTLSPPAYFTLSVCNDSLINTPCEAAFSWNENLMDTCPACIQFTNVSLPSVAALQSVSWTFGDGASTQASDPFHMYPAPGIYPVCLGITTADGCTASLCDTIQISDSLASPCPVAFTASPVFPAGNSFQFQPAASGPVITWAWDFGDGTFATIENPAHTFSAAGNYLVCLSVSYANGCEYSFCSPVLVTDGMCEAAFSSYDSPMFCGPGNESWQFLDQSVSSSGIFSRSWDFGDGGTSGEMNPVHCYNAEGAYQVCLSIVTDNGCQNASCHWVYVTDNYNPNCQAYFEFSPAPGGLQFHDESTGNPSTWFWNFGDGGTASGDHPFHAFNQTGWYEVCLSITNPWGCSDSYCDSVFYNSNGNGCTAEFSWAPDTVNGCGGCFSFSDQSVANGYIQYYWDFGDGWHSSHPNPNHEYHLSGFYEVCLYIHTPGGCSDYICHLVSVNLSPPGYTVAGVVYSDGLLLNQGSVVLMDSTGSHWVTDLSLGQFQFSGIPPSQCICYAFPNPEDNPFGTPAYYPQALFWEEAQGITVNGNVVGIQIDLPQLQPISPGPGVINGWLFWSGLVAAGPNRSFSVDQDGPVSILLFNSANLPVAWVQPSNDGFFQFENLPYGIYKIYVEMAGYETIPAIVTIEPGHNQITGINLVVSGSAVIVGLTDPAAASPGVLFPNPTLGLLNFVDASFGPGTLFSLVGLDGRERDFKPIEAVTPGEYQFDVVSLAPGFYGLKALASDGRVVFFPFVKE